MSGVTTRAPQRAAPFLADAGLEASVDLDAVDSRFMAALVQAPKPAPKPAPTAVACCGPECCA